jgi:CRP-like cAMP-binding protein
MMGRLTEVVEEQESEPTTASATAAPAALTPVTSGSGAGGSAAPPLPRPEERLMKKQIKRARKKFDALDRDRSGALDGEELHELAMWVFASFHPGGQELSVPEREQEAQKIVAQLDANGDGKLDFSEFAEWFIETCTRINTDKPVTTKNQAKAMPPLPAQKEAKAVPSLPGKAGAGKKQSIPALPSSRKASTDTGPPSLPKKVAGGDKPVTTKNQAKAMPPLPSQAASGQKNKSIPPLPSSIKASEDKSPGRQPERSGAGGTGEAAVVGSGAQPRGAKDAPKSKDRGSAPASKGPPALPGQTVRPPAAQARSPSTRVAFSNLSDSFSCRMQNKNSGLLLRVRSDMTVEQWISSDDATMDWIFTRVSDYYTITAKESGLYLTVANNSTRNGSKVAVTADGQAWASHWSVQPASQTGVFTLKSRLSAKYLNVKGAGKAKGAPIQIWKNATSPETQWSLLTGTATSKVTDSPRGSSPRAQKKPPPPPPPMSAQRMLQRARFLQSVPIMANIPVQEQTDVAALLELVRFEAGEVMVAQGEPGDAMYILEDGSAVADVSGQPVREYSSGGYFGELALLDGQPRSASVTAVRPCKCLKLGRRAFQVVAKNSSAALQQRIDEYCANKIQAAWRDKRKVTSSAQAAARDAVDSWEDAAQGDILSKVSPEELAKQKAIGMFDLGDSDIEFEQFMRIVLKMQANYRRRLAWKQMVMETMLAHMNDVEAPEPVPEPEPELEEVQFSPRISPPERTLSPAAQAVDASVRAARAEADSAQLRLSPRATSEMDPSHHAPLPSLAAAIAGTGTGQEVPEEEARQMMNQAEQLAMTSMRSGTPVGGSGDERLAAVKQLTLARSRMEEMAGDIARVELLMQSMDLAESRLERLSEWTESKHQLSSWFSRPSPQAVTVRTRAERLLAMLRVICSGFGRDCAIAPTVALFASARSRVVSEQRVQALVRINREKKQANRQATFDLAAAQPLLESVESQLARLDVFREEEAEVAQGGDTLHRALYETYVDVAGQDGLGGAMQDMDAALDIISSAAVLGAGSDSSAGPAMMRTWSDQFASSPLPTVAASATATTVGGRGVRPVIRSTSSGAGLSVVWSHGSSANGPPCSLPLCSPRCTARLPGCLPGCLPASPHSLSPPVDWLGVGAAAAAAYTSPLRATSRAPSFSPRPSSLAGRLDARVVALQAAIMAEPATSPPARRPPAPSASALSPSRGRGFMSRVGDYGSGPGYSSPFRKASRAELSRSRPGPSRSSSSSSSSTLISRAAPVGGPHHPYVSPFRSPSSYKTSSASKTELAKYSVPSSPAATAARGARQGPQPGEHTLVSFDNRGLRQTYSTPTK